MDSGDTAQLAAVLAAFGAPLVLVARGRAALLAGFALLAAAEAAFALALAPSRALDLLLRPSGAALAVVGLAVLAAAAAVLLRWPSVVIPLALVAAPLRLPVDVGAEHTFFVGVAEAGRLGRLHLLYLVITAGTLALAFRALRGAALPPLPRMLSLPAAAFLAVASLSLLWSNDVEGASTKLAFFLLPFAALVAVVGRTPLEPWVPRALVVTLTALVAGFAAIGLWQAWSRELFFYAPNLEVANAYGSFFRVTSLFTDPSLYGRHLVLALVVLVVLLLRRRLHPVPGIALVALIWGGLYFSYSQSSFVALFVAVAAVALATVGGRTRRLVAVGTVLVSLVAVASVAAAVEDVSARRFTSGRSRLATITTDVFRQHPVAGVGLDAQPEAAREHVGPGAPLPRYTSHTTPLTVAAELGLLGLAAYAALLAGAARILHLVWRRDEVLGLALGAVLLALFVHSLFYSGFYEDPLTWGVIAVAAAFLARAPAGRVRGT